MKTVKLSDTHGLSLAREEWERAHEIPRDWDEPVSPDPYTMWREEIEQAQHLADLIERDFKNAYREWPMKRLAVHVHLFARELMVWLRKRWNAVESYDNYTSRGWYVGDHLEEVFLLFERTIQIGVTGKKSHRPTHKRHMRAAREIANCAKTMMPYFESLDGDEVITGD
jgi:hypothetical protein